MNLLCVITHKIIRIISIIRIMSDTHCIKILQLTFLCIRDRPRKCSGNHLNAISSEVSIIGPICIQENSWSLWVKNLYSDRFWCWSLSIDTCKRIGLRACEICECLWLIISSSLWPRPIITCRTRRSIRCRPSQDSRSIVYYSIAARTERNNR